MSHYSKPYSSPSQLVTMLQSRGLIVENTDIAERYLRRIGYYRFSAYLYPLLATPKQNHLFRPHLTKNEGRQGVFGRGIFVCRRGSDAGIVTDEACENHRPKTDNASRCKVQRHLLKTTECEGARVASDCVSDAGRCIESASQAKYRSMKKIMASKVMCPAVRRYFS